MSGPLPVPVCWLLACSPGLGRGEESGWCVPLGGGSMAVVCIMMVFGGVVWRWCMGVAVLLVSVQWCSARPEAWRAVYSRGQPRAC